MTKEQHGCAKEVEAGGLNMAAQQCERNVAWTLPAD